MTPDRGQVLSYCRSRTGDAGGQTDTGEVLGLAPQPDGGGGVPGTARRADRGGGSDPDLAALRLDFTETLREVLEVMSAGLLARSVTV